MSENGSGKSSTPISPPALDKPPSSSPSVAPSNAAPKGNPAFRAMGLPNFRFRLPSRNWMIFLTIVSSWTGSLVYDRWQKKKVQKKWCTLVEHLALESIPSNMMPRKMTIILAASPGDGLRSTREHFTEYIKPVLVAAAMDWDVIEGRREGEVRAGLAERIRRYRRRKGEAAETSVELDGPTILENSRTRAGIMEFDGTKGDIVIGRNTWKEYVRGLHEGWLGSIDPPKVEEEEQPQTPISTTTGASPDDPLLETQPPDETTDDASPAAPPLSSEGDQPKEEPKKPEKPAVTPAYNSTSTYGTSNLPPSIPSELGPSTPIAFPHILGFLNTPVRMYRFLTRRHLADDIGRQTAAAVMAAHRPFHEDGAVSESEMQDEEPVADSAAGPRKSRTRWEQQAVLVQEEDEWHKAAKQRNEGDGDKEREWLDDMVIDPRIGRRMRRFELEPGDEERARAIWRGAKGIPGRREGDDGGLERHEDA